MDSGLAGLVAAETVLSHSDGANGILWVRGQTLAELVTGFGYDGGAGLYEILHYNEAQTEAERFGLQGPYVIALTDGGAPSSALYAGTLTTSWADSLGISGRACPSAIAAWLVTGVRSSFLPDLALR